MKRRRETAAGVHGLRELEWSREPEVRRHELLERRSRPAPVLAARRRPHGCRADVLAAAPVAADVAERGKARLASVGREAEAVDAGAADDGDAPAAVGAGAEHGERVVRDLDAVGPAALLRARLHVAHLRGEVDAGEQQLGVRDGAFCAGFDHERLDAVERSFDAVLVRRAARAAHEREEAAFVIGEHEIGLRVAAVDGEQQRAHRTASATSESTSASTISICPISGCASSAFRAATGSRVTAAPAVSRS